MRTLHASKGPHGSVVRMADNSHYVRIRGAFNRVPAHIGSALHIHQSATYQILRMHRKMLLVFGGISVVLGVLGGHFIR